jgi:hypothetical protein
VTSTREGLWGLGESVTVCTCALCSARYAAPSSRAGTERQRATHRGALTLPSRAVAFARSTRADALAARLGRRRCRVLPASAPGVLGALCSLLVQHAVNTGGTVNWGSIVGDGVTVPLSRQLASGFQPDLNVEALPR